MNAVLAKPVTATLFTAVNDQGHIMLPAALEQLKMQMITGRAYVYLRHPVPPNESLFAGEDGSTRLCTDLHRDSAESQFLPKDNLTNFYTNFHEDIAGKVLSFTTEKQYGSIVEVKCEIEFGGPKGEIMEEMFSKDVAFTVKPRVITGAHGDDARRRYIHYITGLYFVPAN